MPAFDQDLDKCDQTEYNPRYTGNSGFEGQDLRMSLASLDEKLRICVLLYYIEGFSVREVSRILGISENAVKARLMRGRKRLKALLSEEVFEK